MAPDNSGLVSRIGESITKLGGGLTANETLERIQKLSTNPGLSYSTGYGQLNQPQPPYQRTFSPLWIYKIRRDSPLMNNAMRQKVWQTFRGGLSDWKKAYDAKCPACLTEFNGYDAFRNQMGDEGQELKDDDFDMDEERTCPECEEVVQMLEPNPEVRRRADHYFEVANEREEAEIVPLEPSDISAVGQSFLDVLEEIGWDIQSFDDGWMLFERSYHIDDEGRIYDYDLESVYRAPPELMRWAFDTDDDNTSNDQGGEPGGKFFVCVKCRAAMDDYYPEEADVPCSHCGNKTYEAYAYATSTPAGRGSTPDEFFLRGEFYHDSEYERKRWYGYPPVLTLWEESRTVEQMDKWYNSAYEERRAPRGALLVNAAHDQSLRDVNRQQMEQMREDPNHIPLFMNDAHEDSDPIKFVELLSDPAEMQHMEMREWFLDRISAHFGVTANMMNASSDDSGLSQSMEVEVSEKQAEHFRGILNNFIEAFLAQIGTEGWTRELEEVKEDDPEKEAQLVGQHLNNAQKALQMGAEVEWTDEDRAEIKEGELENPEEGMMDEMGMEGGMQGPRGPAPNSLGPGDDPNGEQGGPLGGPDRERQGPADEDRPAATPLKSAFEYDEDDRLEKIAVAGFEVPDNGEDVDVEA